MHWLQKIIGAVSRGYTSGGAAPKHATRAEFLAHLRDRWAEDHGGERLDPNSVADDMKLLGWPSSLDQRREMARAVGMERYEGTEEDNVQLHALFLDAALGPQ